MVMLLAAAPERLILAPLVLALSAATVGLAHRRHLRKLLRHEIVDAAFRHHAILVRLARRQAVRSAIASSAVPTA